MSAVYIWTGIIWLLVTVMLAIYITGWRMKPEQHIGIGLKAMAVSYFIGAALLFLLVIRFS